MNLENIKDNDWPVVVKKFRDDHDLSQDELSAELGMGTSSIVSHWENGSRKPKPYLALALQALAWRLESRGKKAKKKK